jgi:hypothetical protein
MDPLQVIIMIDYINHIICQSVSINQACGMMDRTIRTSVKQSAKGWFKVVNHRI